jgi:hypothetical protein
MTKRGLKIHVLNVELHSFGTMHSVNIVLNAVPTGTDRDIIDKRKTMLTHSRTERPIIVVMQS